VFSCSSVASPVCCCPDSLRPSHQSSVTDHVRSCIWRGVSWYEYRRYLSRVIFLFLHSHGGTGFGSDHKPLQASRWIPTGGQRYVDMLDQAAEKSWHQNLAPTGRNADHRPEVVDLTGGCPSTPAPPTHDDVSATTHPRSAQKYSWLTLAPAAVRPLDGW